MSLYLLLLATITTAACTLPGTFLVLRRMSLISDAISHVILLGLVATFLLVGDQKSPWLAVGATASGVAAVALVELLQRTRLLKEDAAIGLVFPAMFSLGVILVALKTKNIHLDVDSVLLGDIGLSVERRWYVGSLDFGPKPIWLMAGVLILNLGALLLFYKELKLSTFDPGLSRAMGFRPTLIHYGLMLLVSITAVAAFDAVGPVMVVALMIVPAATATLLSQRLSRVLWLSVALGVFGALVGCWLARIIGDANVAGAIATVLGGVFAVALAAAPNSGLVAVWLRRRRQRWEFFQTMLAVHLFNHEGTASEAEESRVDGLERHLLWPTDQISRVAHRATESGLIARQADRLILTERGRTLARRTLSGPD